MSEWKKVKIGDICKIEKGSTGIASATPGKYPLVVTAAERKTCSTYQFDTEAVCIPLVSSSGHGKKSLNNVHYQQGKFALGTILAAVIPNNPDELSARYLHQYLLFYKDTLLVPLMKGAANVSLSMKDIAKVEIPLPPIEEQQKFAELFVSLQNKNKEILNEFENQTEYAKQLRQNILQDAIEGKLTTEWRKSHPVQKGNPDFDSEALFEKIQEEKCHMDSELRCKSKKQKEFTKITDEEKQFAIPNGWKWVRLGEIFNIISARRVHQSDWKKEGIPFYRAREIAKLSKDGIVKNELFISEDLFKKLSLNGIPQKGDLMISAVGTLGKSYVVKATDKFYYKDASVICIENFITNSWYIKTFMDSEFMHKQIKNNSKGSVVDTLTIIRMNQYLITLPPLAEQKEIVTRVESLLKTVDELENQIQNRQTLAKQLMQGILKDAFEER